jgi:hypothetical protein
MDIKNTKNKCDLKCSFNFNYGETTIQSIITNSSIIIKPGKPSINPVKFNDFEYAPTTASITYPSSTTYNGVTADAEFTIVHSANLQKGLVIRIPISVGSITKPQPLEEIINQTSKLLPKISYTNLNIPSFSFEEFVPKGPFYFSETSASYNIYYGLENSLFITDEMMTTLKQIVISPFKSNMDNLGELFYNSDGSNLSTNGSGGSNFNFLECEQYYEEDIPVTSIDGGSTILQKMASNPNYVKGFFISIVVILGLAFFYFIYKSISNAVNPPEIPKVNKS